MLACCSPDSVCRRCRVSAFSTATEDVDDVILSCTASLVTATSFEVIVAVAKLTATSLSALALWAACRPAASLSLSKSSSQLPLASVDKEVLQLALMARQGALAEQRSAQESCALDPGDGDSEGVGAWGRCSSVPRDAAFRRGITLFRPEGPAPSPVATHRAALDLTTDIRAGFLPADTVTMTLLLACGDISPVTLLPPPSFQKSKKVDCRRTAVLLKISVDVFRPFALFCRANAVVGRARPIFGLRCRRCVCSATIWGCKRGTR